MHLWADQLLALLPLLKSTVTCLCMPAPEPLDLAFWREQLSGRVKWLLFWERSGLTDRSARAEAALALFCEALGLGQDPQTALAATETELGVDPRLRLEPV